MKGNQLTSPRAVMDQRRYDHVLPKTAGDETNEDREQEKVQNDMLVNSLHFKIDQAMKELARRDKLILSLQG
jgi:hypothetical protein